MEKRSSFSLDELLERLPLFRQARLADGDAARVQLLLALKAAPQTRVYVGDVLVRLSLHVNRKCVRELGKSEILLGRREAGAEVAALDCTVKRLPEKIDPAALFEAIRPRTAIVSIDWADPVTGLIQPVHECAEVCRKKGVLLHINATHALGREFVHLKELHDVYISIEGALPYADILLSPGEIMLSPEPPPPWLMEMYQHAVVARLQEFDVMTTQVASLRGRFEEGVKALGAEILHEKEARLPHITALSFPYVHPEMLQYALEKRGIHVRSPLTFVFPMEQSEEDLLSALEDALEEVKPLTEAFAEEKS